MTNGQLFKELEGARKRELELGSELIGVRAQIQLLERLLLETPPIIPSGDITKVSPPSKSKASDILATPDVPTQRVAILRSLIKRQTPFTKRDLIDWLNEDIPALRFQPKSLDIPLADLLEEKAIRIARSGGSSKPHVYESDVKNPAFQEA